MDWIKIETKWFEMAVRLQCTTACGQTAARGMIDTELRGRNLPQAANDPAPANADSGKTTAVAMT